MFQVEYSDREGVEWMSQRSFTTNIEVKELQPDKLYRFRVSWVQSLLQLVFQFISITYN